ncbi:reverse transcriptase-like protein [Citricoccus sp.]|uniref:reverse transcriptase-like protein n=1 Tax=Citricoccus sp. TaxID=1978372 RepID=UPI0028BD84E0|nr:reverse transcriptase-like protein [Citricoccus sp.]
MPQQSTPSAGRLLYVEADGGSRGNPGVAGYGALVRDPDTGAVLDIDAQPLGRASNNVAEYSGMIAGLRMARQIDPDAAVHVRLDSKLVVEQMSGRWKIKHADMQKLAAEARAILPAGQVTYEWIPRAKNKDADLLSNEAMDAGASGTAWVKETSGIKVTGAAPTSASAPAPTPPPAVVPPRRRGRLHHVEIWVEDLEVARSSLGWLFQELGYDVSGEWSEGTSYQGAGEYLVLESGPHVRASGHDRLSPGLNHVAFHAGSRAEVDALTEAARSRGFALLFADRHPFAGGRNHYAAYLEAPNGFEVELVAEPA